MEIAVKSRDEIGQLSNSFDDMRKEVKRGKEHLEGELRNKTHELNERVNDLEKIRDLSADSEIYAEEMRVERTMADRYIKELEESIFKLRNELNVIKKK